MNRLEQELIAHAGALRALARDLAGSGAVDDLVQETALQALQAEPREHGSFAGFFATILRRLASRHRRGERRRLQREQVASRPELQPPVDVLLARQEMLRRLTDALLALPEPYRTVLLQRYYDDRKPGAIAAITGESLATVKSRLQRGLSMLRQQLDHDGARSDWRTALLLAFRPGDAAMTATAIAGVIVMSTGLKLTLGAAAAAAAVAIGWACLGDAPRVPTTVAVGERAVSPVAAGSAADAPGPLPAPERIELPIVAAEATAHASLRGRCVDAAGAPLRGAVISLHADSDLDADQLRAWESRHRTKIVWRDQQTTTAADGTFWLGIAPPPPYRFHLEVQLEGFAEMHADWGDIAAAAAIDTGEIVLMRGAGVSGRVVDTAGMSIGDAWVAVRWKAAETAVAGRGAFHPALSERVQTGADGSFTLLQRLLPGTCELSVEQQVIARGERMVVPVDLAVGPIEVVVLRAEERQTIEGIVVDDDGVPVPRVGVLAMSGGAGGGATPYTDASGHFVVTRRSNQEAEPRLWIMARGSGCEDLWTEATFAWGRRDLRLVLHRGLTVTVQVLRAGEERPVDRFAVRIFRQPDATENAGKGSFSPDYDVRAAGRHDGGIVEVAGIARGPQFVHVDPEDPALAASGLVPVDVREPGPVHVVVHLQRAVQRQARVRFADGSPVSGAAIRVVDDSGLEPGSHRFLLPIENFAQVSGRATLMLMATTTDAGGVAMLRSAAGRHVLLDLPGPGHVPTRIADVALDAAEPLDITVPRGGRLIGTASPRDFVRKLRLDAGMPAQGTGQTDRHLGGMVSHGFALVRGQGEHRERFPADPALPRSMPEPDGTFGFDGVPPGTWELVMDPGSPGQVFSGGSFIAFVTLREGEATKVEVDLSRLAPVTLEGLVLSNGRPLADARLLITCSHDGCDADSCRADTDAAGRFRLRHASATFRVAMIRDCADGTQLRLHAVEVVDIAPGASVERTFTVTTGKLRLCLRDARGIAAAGVALTLRGVDGAICNVLPKTDAAGVVAGDVEAGMFTVFAADVRLGDVRVGPLADADVALQLPAPQRR